MNLKINLPVYSEELGLQSSWEPGFEIAVKVTYSEAVISANKQGLISLAKQLLILAQDEAPTGSHFHLDETNALGPESISLILEKR
ncbi:Imm32 family immunity protein [Sphingobacterium sp. WOUb80]|uniref:Imm32 family immunity protein n=1 Tax=Sphingobacterium sp. WOUb80 TaxID=3234028 RepID=UPI003CF53208